MSSSFAFSLNCYDLRSIICSVAPVFPTAFFFLSQYQEGALGLGLEVTSQAPKSFHRLLNSCFDYHF